MMLKGLFINNLKAKDSIYESGIMVYQCLKLSNLYTIDYVEVSQDNRTIKKGYDFYFFNYHDVTMSWLKTSILKKKLGFVITMILEIVPGNAFVRCPKKHFNFYCALDPTINSNGNLYSFPRPLENIPITKALLKNKIPTIGSFGFATKGKGFEHVVEAVNKEFDEAIVKINIPFGDFVPNSENYSKEIEKNCKRLAKPKVKVIVTNYFFNKEGLVNWCGENDLNCFLYDRNMPGLAATTDQAIISGRPISVSNNETFRHIIHYLKPYPFFSLKESINYSIPIIEQIKKDWSQESFTKLFEKILVKHKIIPNQYECFQMFELPILKKNLLYFIKYRLKKYWIKLVE